MIPWRDKCEGDGWTMYLGDCREIMPTLANASIDFVCSDPPYGHNNNDGDLIHNREAALGLLPRGEVQPHGRPIANDGKEANDLVRFAFDEWNRLLKPGCCCCCCCCGGGPDPQFARWSLWIDDAIGFKQMVVWDKGPMGMGWHYRRSYETVLVAQKPGAACRWFDETNQVENIIRPGHNGISKIIPSASDHPTPKPVELAKHFLNLHTDVGDVCLDSFAGAGWVGQACIETGRKFVGIEIDENYYRIACNRLRSATPCLFKGTP